ncbi:MAG TPA: LytTR family DNA-binding domain-containing protein [Cytophagales bacterium]|nr:LytTR family DNA-binding domain-containing protein [Cytophagales bacterium]
MSYREELIPAPVDQICCFRVLDTDIQLLAADGKKHIIAYYLDILQTLLDPKMFYRANRQHIVAFHAIKELEHYSYRKMLLKLIPAHLEPLVISKAKASDFLSWMERH